MKQQTSRDKSVYVAVFLMAGLILTTVAFAGDLATRGDTNVQLTEAERRWLAAHPVIRVAPDPEFPPFEFFDADGQYSGIAADYLHLIERRLGVRFEAIRLNSWNEALEQAQARQVDLLAAAMMSPQRSKYMLTARPHINLPGVIVASTKTSETLTLEKLKGMKVAVVSGYVWQDLITNDYPDIYLDLVPNVQTGLRKTSFGLVDAMVGDPATTTHYLEQEGITNLRIAGESGYEYKLACLTRND